MRNNAFGAPSFSPYQSPATWSDMDGWIPMTTGSGSKEAKTGCAGSFLGDLPDLDRRQFASSIFETR
jgi:hypothetical protein